MDWEKAENDRGVEDTIIFLFAFEYLVERAAALHNRLQFERDEFWIIFGRILVLMLKKNTDRLVDRFWNIKLVLEFDLLRESLETTTSKLQWYKSKN